MTRYILAHDVGTTGNKATLYDEDGVLVGSVLATYPTTYRHPGWAEQDPRDWWQAFCGSTAQLLQENGVNAGEIACVVFSGQMMGVVAVDARGNALRDALIWADYRSQAEIDEVAARIDPHRVYAITGHRLSPSYSGGKMIWLKKHEPETYERTFRFLQAKDYLACRLTGAFCTDPSDASSTNLFDLEGGRWSDELAAAFEIPLELLPEVRLSTDVVGEVQPAAAREAGLQPETPVVIGGGDGACAATGAGVIREGLAYNYIGSSSWIGVATSKPILDPEMRTFTWAHLIPGMFTPTGTMQAAGNSYQWARDQFARMEQIVADRLGISTYELMNEEALTSPPGARGLLFLPYLLGERSPRWNPQARGAFVGLTIRHTPADLFRAVLEGITFNLRVILEAFLRQGAPITALRVIGGGAQGAAWNTIMADIFGIPVQRLSLLEEATSMGAAVAGGVGIGMWKEFSQVDRMVSIASECRPNMQYRQVYGELYDLFNDIYTALDSASIYDRLAAIDAL